MFPFVQMSVCSLLVLSATPLDVPNCKSLAEDYILISPGKFTMGEIGPENEVEEKRIIEITYYYKIKRTEVTQREYFSLMGINPSTKRDCDDCPVDAVSWKESIDYAVALSRKDGYHSCYRDYRLTSVLDCDGYRLPTEAEWEYAARAGSKESSYGSIDEIAWYKANSNNEYHEVAKKIPNSYGLYDMIGNVWEWTYDTYSYRKTWSEVNPTGNDQNGKFDQGDLYSRVIKGGGFDTRDVRMLTFGGRAMEKPRGSPGIGFRLVRTVKRTESSMNQNQ